MHMYACICVCLYVCMFACLHVCKYIYIYIYTHIYCIAGPHGPPTGAPDAAAAAALYYIITYHIMICIYIYISIYRERDIIMHMRIYVYALLYYDIACDNIYSISSRLLRVLRWVTILDPLHLMAKSSVDYPKCCPNW